MPHAPGCPEPERPLLATAEGRCLHARRGGQYDRAVAIVDALLPTLNRDAGVGARHLRPGDDPAAAVLTDPAEAQRKLAEWEEYTIGKLKLEAFR